MYSIAQALYDVLFALDTEANPRRRAVEIQDPSATTSDGQRRPQPDGGEYLPFNILIFDESGIKTAIMQRPKVSKHKTSLF